MPVKPRAPTASWSYVIYPKGVNCFRSRVGGQTIMKLWEAELSAFHDGDLAQATQQINAILKGIEKNNKDPERKLSFIEFQNRHMLVWASYGAVGPDDDEATVAKALKLKLM
jgi:hypothetical protein